MGFGGSEKTGRFSALSGATDQNVFRPQLTSLIDVMTFLLVFLIKSFSVQGDVITPAADLELPMSISNNPPKNITTIEISKNSISAEGKTLASLPAADSKDPMLVPGVYKWMMLLRNRLTDTTGSREVLIQADREIEFEVLKRVMYSCSKAGFPDFNILALQNE